MEMWEQMGLIAKLVVIGLAIMSVWSIGVMFERYFTYRKARKQSQEFAPAVAEVLGRGNLEEAIELAEQYSKSHLARVVHAGLLEYKSHADKVTSELAIESVSRAIQRATAVGVEDFKRGLNGLATIGATAPFIGLFGTTVGVINAFAGMSSGQETGLAAVAGGISEALVATAIGLFVAVPAVWMYNSFTSQTESYIVEMDNSGSELIDYFLRRRSEKNAS